MYVVRSGFADVDGFQKLFRHKDNRTLEDHIASQ